MGVWYTTRERVKSALDIVQTARNNAQVDAAIEAASRSIDGYRQGAGRLKRRFYPELATRNFSVLSTDPAWRLSLGRHELISATSVVSGGTTIAPTTGYVLEPSQDGPPYDRIDLVQTAYSAWPSGTLQNAIVITGLWGYRADEESVGSLTAQLGASASATASVTWTTARIGVGDILHIDNERMIVTERTWVDSTQNLGGAGLSASMADATVPVSTGSAFAVDELIQIDAERMLIVAVTGNNLTVIRAWDGSPLATHSNGADVYTLTGVELARGQLGTTAAVHNSATTIYRHLVPGLVGDLCAAEAVNQLQQEAAGYGRTQGSGESAVTVGLAGLDSIRRDAEAAFGRRRLWLGV